MYAYDFVAAQNHLRGNVVRTPLVFSKRLSDFTGAQIYLKLENLQATGSFKDRGAFCRLSALTKEMAKQGVVAVSAGNHAQGVAYHAQRLAIPATIVMPTTAPIAKVERTKAFGANVIQEGTTLDEGTAVVERLQHEKGYTLVHPFDDPIIVEGQASVGLELLEDIEDFDDVVVPIGGGGLISGIAMAIHEKRPKVRITGVEVESYPSMSDALGKTPSKHKSVGITLADGIAVKQPGEVTKPIVAKHVDAIEIVDETAIEEAVYRYAAEARQVIEGAGAAPLAAVMNDPERFKGKKVILVACGGNIDLTLHSSVVARGLARNGQLAWLRVRITDVPGALSSITKIVAQNAANIIDVMHKRSFLDIPARNAEIDLGLEVPNAQAVHSIVTSLEEAGFLVQTLSSQSKQIAS